MNSRQPLRCLWIRTEATPELGYGHLQRTLSVAATISDLWRLPAAFLMSDESDDAPVRAFGAEVVRLPEPSVDRLIAAIDPDLGPLVLDLRALTFEDVAALDRAGVCTIVFDDQRWLRNAPATALIDYTPCPASTATVGPHHYFGLDYFPLRREFLGRRAPAAGPTIREVVVTFGGSDPDDLTFRVVEALRRYPTSWTSTVLLGPGYRGRVAAGTHGQIVVRRAVTTMGEIFAESDLAIAGAGGTALELAAMGVPAFLYILSDDQAAIASALAEAGAAVSLGRANGFDGAQLSRLVEQLAADAASRRTMQAAGPRLIDGRGAERVARAIADAWTAHRARMVRR